MLFPAALKQPVFGNAYMEKGRTPHILEISFPIAPALLPAALFEAIAFLGADFALLMTSHGRGYG